MKKILIFSAAIIVCLGISAIVTGCECGGAVAVAKVDEKLPAKSKTEPNSPAVVNEKTTAVIRVLFIGNSYVRVNNLPKVLAKMAVTAKPKVEIEVTDMSKGSYTLERHFNDGDAINAIQNGRFDVVILQEQSLRPIEDKEKMHEAIRKFSIEIERSKARAVLYMTWARENHPETIEALSKAYNEIGQELNIEVSPVGLAWQEAGHRDPNLPLYKSDKSHPSEQGTYLSACVFYARLTGKSPVGLSTGGLKKITRGQASFLQETAWSTFKKYSGSQRR